MPKTHVFPSSPTAVQNLKALALHSPVPNSWLSFPFNAIPNLSPTHRGFLSKTLYLQHALNNILNSRHITSGSSVPNLGLTCFSYINLRSKLGARLPFNPCGFSINFTQPSNLGQLLISHLRQYVLLPMKHLNYSSFQLPVHTMASS